MFTERWHAPRDPLWNGPLTFKYRCLLLAMLIALVHLARFDVTQRPIVTDIRYYVYFAARTLEGQVPHRDFFDNKTQLATFAGAIFDGAGRAVGADPLRAMRVGYLTLTGLAALLLLAIQRRLADGSCVAGLLGMLCYLGFSLLGYLPAIGPLPKLLMGVLASAAALLALYGRWFGAGVCGALAFLDWQIGVLAGLGVFVAALVEPEERLRRTARVVLGGITTLAAFCAYFAWHGALGDAYRQVVLTSLARGTTALAKKTFVERVARILESIEIGCPGHAWLAAVGIAGMAVYLLVAARHRGRPTQRLVVALAVFHYGIVAFSLTDYQAYGDLFALLASLAFFAGIALVEVHLRAQLWMARAFAGEPERGRRAARVAAVTAVIAFALVLRVGRPRDNIVFPDQIAKGASTLEQQQNVARQLAEETTGLAIAFVNCPEQLFLLGRINPLPFAFWNRATYHYFRRSPDERSADSLTRILRAAQLDAVACPTRRAQRDLTKTGEFEAVVLRADSGNYEVVLLRRVRPRSSDAAG